MVKKTIMLIDDDEDDRDLFKEAATIVAPNITCLMARDAEEGLEQLESMEKLPEYIFLDINMPRMDGKEFLKLIKAHPTLKKIPVVVYSTSSHKSELGEYFRLGANNFITKPSEFNLLIAHLRSVLL